LFDHKNLGLAQKVVNSFHTGCAHLSQSTNE